MADAHRNSTISNPVFATENGTSERSNEDEGANDEERILQPMSPLARLLTTTFSDMEQSFESSLQEQGNGISTADVELVRKSNPETNGNDSVTVEVLSDPNPSPRDASFLLGRAPAAKGPAVKFDMAEPSSTPKSMALRGVSTMQFSPSEIQLAPDIAPAPPITPTPAPPAANPPAKPAGGSEKGNSAIPGELRWWKELNGSCTDEHLKAKAKFDDTIMDRYFINRMNAMTEMQMRKSQKKAAWDLLLYVVACIIYLVFVVKVFKVTDAYEMEGAMRAEVERKGIRKVHTIDDAMLWLETGLLMAVFPRNYWYNGEDKDTGYILEYNKLAGGFELSQRRIIEDENCPSARFDDWEPHCWPSLNLGVEDYEPFGPSYDPYRYTWEDNAFGGGYSTYIPPDRTRAIKTIAELKKATWLDKETRSLSVQYVMYNSNKKQFALVRIILDIFNTGLVEYDLFLSSFSLEYWPISRSQVVIEIIIILYTTFMAYMYTYKFMEGILIAGSLPSECIWNFEKGWIPLDVWTLENSRNLACTHIRRHFSNPDADPYKITHVPPEVRPWFARGCSTKGELKANEWAALESDLDINRLWDRLDRLDRTSINYFIASHCDFWFFTNYIRIIAMYINISMYVALFNHEENVNLELPVPENGSVKLDGYATRYEEFKNWNGFVVLMHLIGFLMFLSFSKQYSASLKWVTESQVPQSLLGYIGVILLIVTCLAVMALVMFGHQVRFPFHSGLVDLGPTLRS
ncbi:hypothetical protein CYMTET_49383 [Cymbomonas tetramitiformis]|uniref:Polycystin domain-containing protein n=1 Tax=Cymbomonas tetramitiformis TaxID=36881 RepID=A0AAE0ETY3_9CHLO|nr:hypothetical protein CYMTET_49383 [Cymbomonas tetramitiformis]